MQSTSWSHTLAGNRKLHGSSLAAFETADSLEGCLLRASFVEKSWRVRGCRASSHVGETQGGDAAFGRVFMRKHAVKHAIAEEIH
eukprot:8848507-Alexandrium_andersonii.AAC.1